MLIRTHNNPNWLTVPPKARKGIFRTSNAKVEGKAVLVLN
jgi:hypothetical protein